MSRINATIIACAVFLLFIAIAYNGIGLNLFASFALSSIVALIIMLVCYPPSSVANDSADASLGVYVCLIVLWIAIVLCYFIIKVFQDKCSSSLNVD